MVVATMIRSTSAGVLPAAAKLVSRLRWRGQEAPSPSAARRRWRMPVRSTIPLIGGVHHHQPGSAW